MGLSAAAYLPSGNDRSFAGDTGAGSAFGLGGAYDANEDSDVEEAWLDEITRRLDDHEKGSVRAVPAEVVFAEARDRLMRVRG